MDQLILYFILIRWRGTVSKNNINDIDEWISMLILYSIFTSCAGDWLRTVTSDRAVYDKFVAFFSVWTRRYDRIEMIKKW